MQKKIKIIFIILATIIAGGVTYWQIHKNNIVKHSIEAAIKQKTDSLYYVHYDSSYIDEVAGNATFYNVTLQSDSIQKKILASTDSLPNALYHISVAEVSVKGVDITGLVKGSNVAATEILLAKPVIQVINTGIDKPKPFTAEDTLQLYKKILGKFTSIKANNIAIQNGTLLITNKNNKPLTTIENINISLRNFLIDSSHNYDNLMSYFIKDINVSVNNIQLPETENNTRVNIEKFSYDAPGKKLQIGKIQQYKTGDMKALTDLKNIVFHDLNTDAFIKQRQVRASGVTCDGGIITIYKKEKKDNTNTEKSLEFSSEFIDAIQISNLKTNNTTIIIKNESAPNETPFVINDMQCIISNIKPVTKGSTISSLISDAVWEINVGGFSFLSSQKRYEFSAKNIRMTNLGSMHADEFALKPLLSEKAFSAAYPYQIDRYDFSFKNMTAMGIDYKKFIASKSLEIDKLTVQPILKVYNNRTLPSTNDNSVKIYPHQAMLKFPFQLYVKHAQIKNGEVAYKEIGEGSALPGITYFNNINGEVDNITNIPEKINLNSKLKLKVNCLFIGRQKLQTEWVLPLRSSDSVFTVKGETGFIDAQQLNQLTEPLAMLSVKQGVINKFNFDFEGTNYTSKGKVVLLYNDLKVEVLKRKDEELKKKGLLTLLANTLIKNDNPKNDKIREGVIDHKRDIRSSFFNMLWKSLLTGIKSTVIGK